MKTKTLLPGKDLSLEETIDKCISFLQKTGLKTEAVSWLNPAPSCWSVHIQATSCPHLYSNGKGISQLAALASGLGEFLERLSTNFFFADYFLDDNINEPPFLFYPNEKWFSDTQKNAIPLHDQQGTKLLSKSLRAFYDPEGELTFQHLCDNNSNSTKRGICALPFQSLRHQKTTYFPISLLNNLYVSNGMAAGNSPAECCSQALSEIIERYVKNIIITKGISLPEVPPGLLNNYPKLIAILDTLKDQGFSVRVQDASLGGRFPVISVLLTDADSGGAFAAFSANCRFETAIERTLTELLQGRNLDGLRQFQPLCHDIDQVADAYNIESHFVDSDGLLSWDILKGTTDFEFSPWDFTGTTAQEFNQLQRLIEDNGFDIYRAEYHHCGMYSCRILVPGMSEIYPIDDLVWNNKGTGALLRPYLLRLGQMNPEELTEVLKLIDSLGLSDEALLSLTIGILFNEKSVWATLRTGELKALIYLALNDREEALNWCNWCLDYGALPKQRNRLFRLLQTLLTFRLQGRRIEDYEKNMVLFYREDEIYEAKAVLKGTIRFPGLHFAERWTGFCSDHKKLLQIYQNINVLKGTSQR